LSSLRQEFLRLKLEGILVTDHHKYAEDSKGGPELKRRITRGEIDAIIAPHLYGKAVDWAGKLPVPTAIHSPSGKRHTISFDNRQFADLALGALKKQGCKTVGFVLPTEKKAPYHADSVGKLFDYFKEAAKEHGLEWNESWIVGTKPGQIIGDELSQEQFGFEAFTRLWKKKNLPDGLAVYPDTSCRGLVTAALFHGVSIPGQLKLALHRNSESPFLCPVETYFIESSASETAKMLIKHIFDQTKEKCNTRQDSIPFHLRFHRAGNPI
jgi:DNA-binding LacI/PurR family transcriptional regulator